jgi:hypothetical protein
MSVPVTSLPPLSRLRVGAVFIIDPWFVGEDKVGVNRYNFMLESLTVRAPLRRLAA